MHSTSAINNILLTHFMSLINNVSIISTLSRKQESPINCFTHKIVSLSNTTNHFIMGVLIFFDFCKSF